MLRVPAILLDGENATLPSIPRLPLVRRLAMTLSDLVWLISLPASVCAQFILEESGAVLVLLIGPIMFMTPRPTVPLELTSVPTRLILLFMHP